jgi:hypothetical protein
LGIVPGCSYRRIENPELDAQGGGRGKYSSRARGSESIAGSLAGGDSKELDTNRTSCPVVGVGVADEDRIASAYPTELESADQHLGRGLQGK